MSKAVKKRRLASKATPTPTAKPSQQNAATSKTEKTDAGSKQSRVIAMLQSSAGMTIAAMMRATGWQQHSVRGFLAGVVRKRLKLKLISAKVDGQRIYRIASGDGGKAGTGRSKQQAS
jgi:hypothetical protein